jgi:hypothetical protein
MKSKNTSRKRETRRTRKPTDDLRREYHFDRRKSKPNRFARRLNAADVVVVILDRDVAKVFHDSASVNAALRAGIAATKKRRSRSAG